MIKFFRQIRQKLLVENNFSKYLIYAIGEIVLVVIGILIALQINNWNENRKLKVTEIKTLKELRVDLELTLNDVEADQDYFQRCIVANKIIMNHMVNKLPYNDSLSKHFANLFPFATFSINKSTYENIRQSGTTIISNDSLRKIISAFYDGFVNLYKELEDRALNEHYENTIKPMLISSFYTYSNQDVKPRDYEAFIRNEQYHQTIRYGINMFENFIGIQAGMIITINSLISDINEEIENLE